VISFALAHPISTAAVLGGVMGGVSAGVNGQNAFVGIALGAGLGIVGGPPSRRAIPRSACSAVRASARRSLRPRDRTGDIQHLAYELRHVAQFRALGTLPFYAKYRYQSATRLDQFHQPGNRTLEPEYVL
jgi:hypothetical protein